MVRTVNEILISFAILLYAIGRKSQARNLFFYVEICYTEIAALLHSILWRKEVSVLDSILSFLVSVAAGVIANCISKWLDGCSKDSKH